MEIEVRSVGAPRPLLKIIDRFVAMAIVKFHTKVELLSYLDLLVYGGDDWPQPHPMLKMPRLPWEDWPTKTDLLALRPTEGRWR